MDVLFDMCVRCAPLLLQAQMSCNVPNNLFKPCFVITLTTDLYFAALYTVGQVMIINKNKKE